MLALAISVGVKLVMSNHTYMVGDACYLQKAGGAIGLELTGAVSRPSMMKWDSIYLEKVRRAGIEMKLYRRYIDDSNQVVKVPQRGYVYDVNQKKLVYDEVEIGEENDEERIAKMLKVIANEVMDGIEMESDFPTNNNDGKMPILDMKVWMSRENHILYQHYEKVVASKQIMNAQSAQSSTCKRNVHVREVVRRMLNTSTKLDWDSFVAPCLTDYMKRMQIAGYDERYRKNTLQNGLRIYDKMIKEQEQEIRPINRPRNWNTEERRKKKKQKKHSWSAKGGYIAPIFVPATPDGELAKEMKEIAEREAVTGLKFKIIETGGNAIKHLVQRSNPTATPGCPSKDCLACKEGRGKGGSCLKSNIQYELECGLCTEEQKGIYIGESSRNLYTRGKEHVGKYRSRKRNHDSFMKKHQQEKHGGREADFKAKVTGVFRDSLSRQVSEGVHIRRGGRSILNSKSEWHQPALWRVCNELIRE